MIPIQRISAQLLSWTASQRATPSTQNSARGRRWPAMTGDDRRWPASVKMVKSEVMHCCSGSWYILIHRGVEILNQKQLLINMVGLMFRVRLKGYVLTMWLHCLNCKCSHYTAKRLRARHDVDYPLASPTVALDCNYPASDLLHLCSIGKLCHEKKYTYIQYIAFENKTNMKQPFRLSPRFILEILVLAILGPCRHGPFWHHLATFQRSANHFIRLYRGNPSPRSCPSCPRRCPFGHGGTLEPPHLVLKPMVTWGSHNVGNLQHWMYVIFGKETEWNTYVTYLGKL